jgi:hypothetical protein
MRTPQKLQGANGRRLLRKSGMQHAPPQLNIPIVATAVVNEPPIGRCRVQDRLFTFPSLAMPREGRTIAPALRLRHASLIPDSFGSDCTNDEW